jgi:uncharacterized protein
LFKNRSVTAFLGILLFAGLAGTAFAQNADIPRSPDRWVTDKAGFLSAATVDELDSRLETFERTTGRQIIVYIDKTTGGTPLEDWASKAFQAWKVGRKGLDDGLAVFIMAEDRKVRVEVGYGLEGLVPDITAGRIINDIMVPAIRNGENDAAVGGAVNAFLRAIAGEGEAGAEAGSAEAQSPSQAKSRYSKGQKVLSVIAIVFFLILFITNPRLALWLLFSLLSGGGGRGGRGGRGGGSFGGGGGRSGGGGASGSW